MLFRNRSTSRTANPVHNRLQNRLFELLLKRYGKSHVRMEVQGVDIRVKHPDLYAFIEVKSCGDPRLAIRTALGQLLEYAFLESRDEKLSPKLYIAAPGKPNHKINKYLDLLRDQFKINLEYVVVSEEMTEAPL